MMSKLGQEKNEVNYSDVREDRVVTNSTGNPINEPFVTQRIGEHGPLLLQIIT